MVFSTSLTPRQDVTVTSANRDAASQIAELQSYEHLIYQFTVKCEEFADILNEVADSLEEGYLRKFFSSNIEYTIDNFLNGSLDAIRAEEEISFYEKLDRYESNPDTFPEIDRDDSVERARDFFVKTRRLSGNPHVSDMFRHDMQEMFSTLFTSAQYVSKVGQQMIAGEQSDWSERKRMSHIFTLRSFATECSKFQVKCQFYIHSCNIALKRLREEEATSTPEVSPEPCSSDDPLNVSMLLDLSTDSES